MYQKGYKIKNMTINIRQANFLGPLSMLPFIALTFLFCYNVDGFDLGEISLGFVVAAFLFIPLTYLQRRGYPAETASTLKEARTAIQEEMPLVICCDLDLPDDSGMDFLDEVRVADKELPFILVSCHDKENYEQEAKHRIFENKEIELILCDVELPDGTAMELFHALRRVAGMFQMKNPPVRLLPFFILTENSDLATEYEYRHEGVNDYITAPVNIPELIRRVLFFVE